MYVPTVNIASDNNVSVDLLINGKPYYVHSTGLNQYQYTDIII